VSAFQKSAGLAEDGVAGAKTLAAVNESLQSG
jgi:peptidoglycan hydrolase-like protein with peptidoglycan-binding domain